MDLFDLSDEDLGRLVKRGAALWEDPEKPAVAVTVAICTLAHMVVGTNAGTARFVAHEITSHGRSLGDWEVIIRKRTWVHRLAGSVVAAWQWLHELRHPVRRLLPGQFMWHLQRMKTIERLEIVVDNPKEAKDKP